MVFYVFLWISRVCDTTKYHKPSLWAASLTLWYKLATKNLHVATIFLQLIGKRWPEDFLISSPVILLLLLIITLLKGVHTCSSVLWMNSSTRILYSTRSPEQPTFMYLCQGVYTDQLILRMIWCKFRIIFWVPEEPVWQPNLRTQKLYYLLL